MGQATAPTSPGSPKIEVDSQRSEYFPALMCGIFVFSSVSAPRPLPSRPPSSLTHSHSHTHSLTLTHSHTHTLTHCHLLTHTHSVTHTHPPHSHTLTHSHSLTLTHTHKRTLTHSHSLSLTHSLIHSLTPSLPHSLTPSPPHPLTHSLTRSLTHSLTVTHSSASFAWQAWDNVHYQGVGCTPWRPSGSASFVLRGVAQTHIHRRFAWQA